MASYPEKERYRVDDLVEIMKILRSPEGCPWDREQTHESIRSNLLEETHEAIEAIDRGDRDLLREELGDVLLQVVFHAEMEREQGGFTFDDVADGICRKLITRHPHVFGEIGAQNAAEALKNWDAVKRQTKGTDKESDLMANLPRSLPALMRAAKVQGRAKRVGFDWPDKSGAVEALDGEVAELKEALASGDAQAIDEELGDVLFSAVNVSRFVKVDAELSLQMSTDKFIRRFRAVESLAKERGIDLSEASLPELDALWDEVKKTM